MQYYTSKYSTLVTIIFTAQKKLVGKQYYKFTCHTDMKVFFQFAFNINLFQQKQYINWI